MISRRLLWLILVAVWAIPVNAATPPPLVNYQGVLRDNNDKPLTGTFDISFHFFDALSAGNEILVDAHTSGNSNAVVVTNGLFNVLLGGGTVSDGSGPGFYTSLDAVFRYFDTVYLELQIGSETLSPRTRLVAAPFSLNSSNLGGLPAASYVDTTSGGQIKEGALACDQGLLGYNDSGIGFGFGVWGRGKKGGGEFLDSSGGSSVDLAIGDKGVNASSYITGIEASGNITGGYFHNPRDNSLAYLASSGVGVQGDGALGSSSSTGGFFRSFDGGGLFASSVAFVASSGGYGIKAYGNTASGYFATDDTCCPASSATLASGNWGIQAVGKFNCVGCGGAGKFYDQGGGALAYVGYANVGIETHASGSGGSFYNTNGISTALAIPGGIGLSTNGTKNFVQNHPEDPNAVVAYTALEGDEAGTYTRGTARLVNGEARITLGETFKWVTNPDIGLTAHLTPLGEWADLYVVSKSTKELVVRSRDPHSGDVEFDYTVFGLRVGFENSPVVREREHDLPIPAGTSGESLFAKKPEFQRFTAFSRFSRMRKEVLGKDEPLDLSGTEALKSAIHVFNLERDGDAFRAPVPASSADAPNGRGAVSEGSPGYGSASAGSRTNPVSSPTTDGTEPHHANEAQPASLYPQNTSPVTVEGSIRLGDVVTVTDAPAGKFVLAGKPFDRGVVGIIGGTPDVSWTGQAPLVMAGTITLCNVDASSVPIAVGDLLVSSATPGHAMRANETPPPGTVVAKALEPLEGGTGTIRVLVLSR